VILKSYQIKKNIADFLKYNFILLYGENDGLKEDITKLIKENITKKDNSIEHLSIYEKDIIENQDKLYESIYSGSLFSNQKIINIKYASDKIFSPLNDILEKYPKNIFLIIFAGILEKKSKLRNLFEKSTKAICIPCYQDSEKDLRVIAEIEFKKNNISLSSESINFLIEKCNSERANLRNEIKKIVSFAYNKKTLKIDDLKSIINFSGEYKSDSFINDCLCGNIIQYKKILSELYENTVNQILLLRVLNNKIQRLLKLKEMEKNSGTVDNLLNSLKPPIFWMEKPLIKKQLGVWSLIELKKIVPEINDIELLCKKNPQISKAIFFNFFNKLCKRANNYS